MSSNGLRPHFSGSRAARTMTAWPQRSRGLHLTLLLLSTLLSSLFVVGACSRPKNGSSNGIDLPRGTPVVLISIDTLRSDRLPAYGNQEVKTPAIDRLRQDSILFRHAYTHANQTLPSHTSILSGRRPFETGVRDNIGYQVSPDELLLPEILQANGYRTGGFVSAFVLRSETGINQGFDVYDDHILVDVRDQLGALQRPGGETLSAATAWLRGVAKQPFFLFFHIYEPHSPYQPAEPFAHQYSDPYNGEVATADAIVGRLLDELRALGHYDDALIILLSDHGEGLDDHGEKDHIVFIYREVLQVPLLVKLPQSRRGGTEITAPAQLADVTPTVLAAMRVRQTGSLPGAVLFDLDDDPQFAQRPILSESMYPRVHFGWSDLGSVVSGPLHLLDGPEPELFDLEADPGEKQDVLRDRRADYRRLKAAIDGVDRTLEAGNEVDAETRERLAALGYVAGGTTSRSGPLPDPRSRRRELELLNRGARLAAEKEDERAIAAFQELLELDGDMIFAHQQLGRLYQKVGRMREGINELKIAYEASGHSAPIAVTLADMYLSTGDFDQARAHALLAQNEGQNVDHVLARIALQEGKLEESANYLAKALARTPNRNGLLITQATLLNRQERFDDALAVTVEAEHEFGNGRDRSMLSGIFHQRGLALGSLGRRPEAIAAFRREIQVDSDSLAAYTHLAFLLVLEGEADQGITTLRNMIERNEKPAAYIQAARTLSAIGDPDSARRLLATAQGRWPKETALHNVDLSKVTPDNLFRLDVPDSP